MLILSSTEIKGRCYRLEPGDGTSYVFSIVDWDDPENDPKGVVGGIGSTGEGYVTLTIQMPGGSGLYEVAKAALREPIGPFLGYLKGHGFESVYPYTLAAVVLAAGVLVDDPDNLFAAAEAMLRAPELLQEKPNG